MKIEKGGLAYIYGIWYVIVAIRYEKGEVGFDCLCDHANNIFYHKVSEVEYFASLKEIHANSFGRGSDKFNDLIRKREIPYRVITEVLSGGEDDRFDHWHEDSDS